jgi:hypothetical protein
VRQTPGGGRSDRSETASDDGIDQRADAVNVIRWASSRIIARGKSGLADARVSSNCAPGTGTMSPAATSLSLVASETTSKDREVAASHHGDTPHSG